MHNPIQAVHTYMAAINALDADAYAACFTDNAEIHEPVGAPPARGRDGARAFMGQFAPLIDRIYIRAGKLHLAGDQVAFTWALEATGKNGRTAFADGIDIMHFSADGRIDRIQGHWDAASFAMALNA